jgi:hypothetical protein
MLFQTETTSEALQKKERNIVGESGTRASG